MFMCENYLPSHNKNILLRISSVNNSHILSPLKTIPYSSQNQASLRSHIECVEDQEYLRSQLSAANLVAFVCDGAVLPRRSGADDRPMDKSNVTLFESPESLRVSFDLPHAGRYVNNNSNNNSNNNTDEGDTEILIDFENKLISGLKRVTPVDFFWRKRANIQLDKYQIWKMNNKE